ncbi:MAG: hypothetical protein RJQ09_13550 [Cyclobacteriaceae bacterium]
MESKLNKQSIEAYSTAVADKLIEQFFQTKKTITGQEIVKFCGIKQVNYFILKNLFAKWQAETTRLESPYFDYKNNGVRNAMKALMNVLSQNILVNEEDLKPLLSESIQETLFLLLSPYDYYHQNIDKCATLNLRFLKSQAKYIKINKHLYMHLLDALEQGDDSSELTKESVSEKLDGVLKSTSEAPEDIEAVMTEFNSIHPVEASDFFVDAPELTAEEEEQIDDIQNNLFENFEEMDELAIEKSRQQLNDKFSKEQKTLNDKLSATETMDIATAHAEKSVQSILKSISINHRFMFIKELFDGQTETFESSIKELEDCSSFEDAVSQLVQGPAKNYGWEMQSPEVKELLRVVIKRFK